MKYFLDTEFIEYPCTIELISIGIVREDGREFYAENIDADLWNANDFVNENVIPNTRWLKDKNPERYIFINSESMDKERHVYICDTKQIIARDIVTFINAGKEKPEFWGYYADYDWVVFCWLFGPMIALPHGWPMYCRDLKQLADSIGNPKFDNPKGEHNALSDAKWNKEFYEFLKAREPA